MKLWALLVSLCFGFGVGGEDALDHDDACHKSNPGECAASWLQRRAHRVQETPPADAHKLVVEGKLLATSSEVHSYGAASAESFSAANSSASFCDTHTGGTCKYFSCKSSRGPTQCVAGLLSKNFSYQILITWFPIIVAESKFLSTLSNSSMTTAPI